MVPARFFESLRLFLWALDILLFIAAAAFFLTWQEDQLGLETTAQTIVAGRVTDSARLDAIQRWADRQPAMARPLPVPGRAIRLSPTEGANPDRALLQSELIAAADLDQANPTVARAAGAAVNLIAQDTQGLLATGTFVAAVGVGGLALVLTRRGAGRPSV